MRNGFAAATLVTLSFTSALAQTSPFIIDRNRADRTLPPALQATPLPPQPQAKLAAIAPFVLQGVQIQGTSLAPAILEAATKGFVGQQIDTTKLSEIANAVSSAYAGQGDIALYTVTVPRQAFDKGILVLVVTEGFISHVDLTGDTDHVGRIAELASKLTQQKPLHRSTLERYLSLIRDQPGLTVDAQLLNTDVPGALRLLLTLHQKPFAVTLNINDGGNSLLGRVQGEADVSLYNLLRDGDETKVSFGTSTIFNRYQSYGLSHVQALDDEGSRATLSYSYLHTNVAAPAISGDAQSLQLALSHPLIRGYDENLSIGASIDGLNSGNALFGQLLATEHVRALRLSSSYAVGDTLSSLALSGSMNFGIDGLGAKVTNPAAEKTGFHKLALQERYAHLLAEQWVVRLAGSAQLGMDRLPVSEFFALGGGPDFGRAFAQAAAIGDSGVAASLEISYIIKGLTGNLAGLELFGFGDTGTTWQFARPFSPAADHQLSSAGMGIRLPVGQKTRLEAEAANAVSANAPGTKTGDWRFLFAVTMRD